MFVVWPRWCHRVTTVFRIPYINTSTFLPTIAFPQLKNSDKDLNSYPKELSSYQNTPLNFTLQVSWVGLVSEPSYSGIYFYISRLQLTITFHSDDKDDQYNKYNDAIDTGNHASLGHEVLAGGAAFAAMKVFEDRQRKDGE